MTNYLYLLSVRLIGRVSIYSGSKNSDFFTFLKFGLIIFSIALKETMTIYKIVTCKRPPLWPRSNVVASHATGLGSNLGRVTFLVEVFSWVFPQL